MERELNDNIIIEYLDTNESGIEKKVKTQTNIFCDKIKILLVTLITVFLFTKIYCKVRGAIYLSETVSYNNPISYPFVNLFIEIPDNIDINLEIWYVKKNIVEKYVNCSKKKYIIYPQS